LNEDKEMNDPGRFVRVGIAESREEQKAKLSDLIKEMDGFTLAGAVPVPALAEMMCEDYGVELLLMNPAEVEGVSGMRAAKQIKMHHPEIKIIFLITTQALQNDDTVIEDALKIGVDSVIFYESAALKLGEVMRECMAGRRRYLGSPLILEKEFAEEYGFNKTEYLLLYELEDFTSKSEIAGRFGIPPERVEEHMRHMLELTGCTDMGDLRMKLLMEKGVASSYISPKQEYTEDSVTFGK